MFNLADIPTALQHGTHGLPRRQGVQGQQSRNTHTRSKNESRPGPYESVALCDAQTLRRLSTVTSNVRGASCCVGGFLFRKAIIWPLILFTLSAMYSPVVRRRSWMKFYRSLSATAHRHERPLQVSVPSSRRTYMSVFQSPLLVEKQANSCSGLTRPHECRHRGSCHRL